MHCAGREQRQFDVVARSERKCFVGCRVDDRINQRRFGLQQRGAGGYFHGLSDLTDFSSGSMRAIWLSDRVKAGYRAD